MKAPTLLAVDVDAEDHRAVELVLESRVVEARHRAQLLPPAVERPAQLARGVDADGLSLGGLRPL